MADENNVTVLGDIADDYDALVAYDEKLLAQWVEDGGYSTSRMVVASTTSAFMQFAKVFVDVGRLGNGLFVEGGWKGAGKDALRLLNLAGGAGAAVSRGGKMLKLTQAGNTCAWSAQAKALRLAGHRWFMTAKDMATRAGTTNAEWSSIMQSGRLADDYTRIANLLTTMRIPYNLVQVPQQSLTALVDLLKVTRGGVTTFSIRFGQSGAHGHRLYATYSRTAGLVIRDPANVMKVYRSLSDLRKAFGQNVSLSGSEVIFIKDALLATGSQLVQRASEAVIFVFQMLPLVPVPAGDPETAAQALQVRDTIASISRRPSPTYHVVGKGDALSKLAGRYYGNQDKWPVIHAANMQIVGANPHYLQPNQKLLIPELPRMQSRIPASRGPAFV